MKKHVEFGAKVIMVGAFISLLSGCKVVDTVKGWFSGKCPAKTAKPMNGTPKTDDAAMSMSSKQSGPWMIRMSGQPVFSKEEFDESLESLVASPQFRGAVSVDSLPMQMKMKVKLICFNLMNSKNFLSTFQI